MTAATLAGAPPSPWELATAWHVHPATAAAIAAAASCYLLGVARLRRTRLAARSWPRRRTAAFMAGLGVLGASLQSGLDAYAGSLLSVHMVQHLVLTMLVPPLLLLGAPATLALRALSPSARRPLARVLTSRAALALSRPLVAWALFTAVLLGTHFSPLYDAAVRDGGLHFVEHALYLASGLLFWLPLVGGDPVPRSRQPALRVLQLLLAMPPMTLVGVVLLTETTVRYPAYVEAAAALGVSALADQHLAGTIMWIAGGLSVVAATLAVGWAALTEEEGRALARERHAGRRAPSRPEVSRR